MNKPVFFCGCLVAWLGVFSGSAQVQTAGVLYVDLRASDASAGTATWTNRASLGNFSAVGGLMRDTNVAATGIPGVLFVNGNNSTATNAYAGPNSVADVEGGSDRSIEVWAYNPALAAEETVVSWGHRGFTRQDMAFNFGNDGTWGAATHWADDVSWGATIPSAAAWHHLAYTYSNQVVRVYVDGVLANTKTLGGVLNTFAGEPINLACQRDSANGARSHPYSGYLNTVRIHGGVLSGSQILSNYLLGPDGKVIVPPLPPEGLAATAGYNEIYLRWNTVGGATSYRLKRAAVVGGPYSLIVSNLTTPSYLDTGLSPGTNYFYLVSSVNSTLNSIDSSPVSVTPGVPAQAMTAGTLYVDLRSGTVSTAGTVWTNRGSLAGNFNAIGAPAVSNNVAGSGVPGIYLDGGATYQGPNSGSDLDGGSDRSIEVWANNPQLDEEETMVSWGHRGSDRQDMAFNFGNNAEWGAATHWADDVGWGDDPPSSGTWQHLVYTYENGQVKVYVNGQLQNTKMLAGSLNTYATEPINLGCQRDSANGLRSHQYSGYLNTVRIHGNVLNEAQVQANYYYGPDAPPAQAVDDSITLNPGKSALIAVLANDNINNVFAPAVMIVQPPASGTAVVRSDGQIFYTHSGGPGTTDFFTYQLSDQRGRTSNVATVSLNISSALRLLNTTVTIPNTPPPAAYQLVDAFPGLSFKNPVALRTPPGNTNQLFVVERPGIISYIPDVTATNPVRLVFLNIANQVQFDDTAEGEMGMLGMDFHPGFATNGLFFVYYMAPGVPYYDRLSRFTANPNTLTVNTNTQQILISVTDEEFNHNGGDVHFGNDGYLYLSMGDEGGQYNYRQNSQRIDKDFYSGILRLDVDKKPGSIEPTAHSAVPRDGANKAYYSIPADNPFVNATTFLGSPINLGTLRAEFYAVGLRHVWRFSIDRPTGEIWAGDVGQDTYEEVDLIQKGLNYGWAYDEAMTPTVTLYPGQAGTLLSNPPPSFTNTPPLWYYPHTGSAGGDPNYKGNSISGGVVYRGTGIPELAGSYIFGDFESANVWSLVRTNSSVTIQRLTGQVGVAAFGADPANGDLLVANYVFNKIQRLVKVDSVTSGFPAKLSATGLFADVTTLAPNPGVVNYEPIISFWSDHAIKRRWFVMPDAISQMTFSADGNWSYPTGMKWIKHFDLETERGNPSTKRRIETRVLVKTDTGSYGVSYRWNDAQTDADLVGEAGTNFFMNIVMDGNTIQQQVEIPSRTACLSCHTVVSGHALSFNTRQLNQTKDMNGFMGNQIDLLSQSGYFTAPVPDIHTLPAYASASDTNYSLAYRVRSYLAVNCVQCHQSGGTGPTWDARPYLTLDQTHLLDGVLVMNGNDPANKVIAPGDANHSVLWRRLRGDGFQRMPPLATHELDLKSIDLVAEWINGELTNHLTFEQWQVVNFSSTNNPLASAGVDADGDGANNRLEYLTGTNPNDGNNVWRLDLGAGGGLASLTYPRVPNLGVLIETSTNIFDWTLWNIPGNQPVFGLMPGMMQLQGPIENRQQYFRARLIEP